MYELVMVGACVVCYSPDGDELWSQGCKSREQARREISGWLAAFPAVYWTSE